MNAKDALRIGLEMSEHVCLAYLGDLTDEDMLRRPHRESNHINWQVGHLICSENLIVGKIAAVPMPELPEHFLRAYTKATAQVDVCSDFLRKDDLLAAYRSQRAGTLDVLDALSEDALDEPTGIEYAPTKAAVINMQGGHWLMHCGQWVIVRRELGKPIVI